MSSSAVFLLPVLTFSLIVAFSCWGIGDGRRVTLRSGLACLTCCAPSLVYGAVIRTAFHSHPVLTRVDQGSRWSLSLYECFNEKGASLFFWIAMLPVLAFGLRHRAARAYLVGLPVVLLLTTLNPLSFPWVARYLTSYHTHFRLFWLIPFTLGISSAIVLAADALASTWNLAGRWGTAGPVAIVLATSALLTFLPDEFVWDSMGQAVRIEAASVLDNPYKVPRDLLGVLVRARDERFDPGGRILFQESLSQFIAPYFSRKSYVSTRSMYTRDATTAVGARVQGDERLDLAGVFLAGNLGADEARRLVATYRVSAVLIDTASSCPEQTMREAGFLRLVESGRYQLWVRRESTDRP